MIAQVRFNQVIKNKARSAPSKLEGADAPYMYKLKDGFPMLLW